MTDLDIGCNVSGMSNKNPSGVLHRSPQEWGSKARKAEDHLRGVRGRARTENISEQLEDMEDED